MLKITTSQGIFRWSVSVFVPWWTWCASQARMVTSPVWNLLELGVHFVPLSLSMRWRLPRIKWMISTLHGRNIGPDSRLLIDTQLLMLMVQWTSTPWWIELWCLRAIDSNEIAGTNILMHACICLYFLGIHTCMYLHVLANKHAEEYTFKYIQHVFECICMYLWN